MAGILIHGDIGIPSTVSLTIVRLAGALLLVGLLQFIAVVFFAATNPAAKVRSGRPTATAQSVDYFEQQYNRRA